MIENEVAIMRLCRHPNIVKLIEEFETIEHIYLVLELVRGGDLFDAITESLRYDESTAAALVKDLAAPIGKNSNVPFMFYFFRIPPCTKHSPPRCET